MNEQQNKDFFPEISAQDAHLSAPEIYQPYEETEEDLLHERRVQEIEAQIDEKFGVATPADEELGELPYDAEADRKRWDALEKDFERVFDEAEKQ